MFLPVNPWTSSDVMPTMLATVSFAIASLPSAIRSVVVLTLRALMPVGSTMTVCASPLRASQSRAARTNPDGEPNAHVETASA